MRIKRIKSRGDKETAAVCTRPNLSELVDGERERIERERMEQKIREPSSLHIYLIQEKQQKT